MPLLGYLKLMCKSNAFVYMEKSPKARAKSVKLYIEIKHPHNPPASNPHDKQQKKVSDAFLFCGDRSLKNRSCLRLKEHVIRVFFTVYKDNRISKLL